MLRIRPGRARVQIHDHARAPIEEVFARISDHEGLRDWLGVSDARLLVEGTPRNGLGAVRRVTALGFSIDEKVVQWEPPARFDYMIVRGLPVDHRGSVRLFAREGGVDIEWTIDMRGRLPLVAEATALVLRPALGRALRHFCAGFSS